MSLTNEINVCLDCSTSLLRDWKGWPLRDPAPMIRFSDSKTCKVCGGNNLLSPKHFRWKNFHSEFSTGLPDYFTIESNIMVSSQPAWGKPYRHVKKCAHCKKYSFLSSHFKEVSRTSCGCERFRPNPKKDVLELAFLETVYESKIDDSKIQISLDEVCEPLNEYLTQHRFETFAFLTAFNPHSTQTTNEENRTDQGKLLKILRSIDCKIFEGEGKALSGEWPPEPSFLVLGISFNLASALGREFRQTAIVFGHKDGEADLIWTRPPVSSERA